MALVETLGSSKPELPRSCSTSDTERCFVFAFICNRTAVSYVWTLGARGTIWKTIPQIILDYNRFTVNHIVLLSDIAIDYLLNFIPYLSK